MCIPQNPRAAYRVGWAILAVFLLVVTAAGQEEGEKMAERVAERLLKGSWDRHALKSLVAVLQSNHSNDETRAAVADLLKGERYGPAVDSVIGALKDRNWRVRADAAGILSDITSGIRVELHENAVPGVMKVLKEELPEEARDEIEQRWRKVLLGMLAAIETKAPPALIKALNDSHSHVCVRAADALGNIGAKSAAGPLLKVLTTTRDPELMRSAAIALGGIGDKGAVPVLVSMLRDRRRDVRTAAVQGLYGIGSGAIPALIQALRSDDQRMREKAELLLSRIGDHSALDGLIDAAKARNWRTRVAAIDLLGQVGHRLIYDRLDKNAIPSLLEDATPKLSELTEDETERMKAAKERQEAVATIDDIVRKIMTLVLPSLVRDMDDPNPAIRAAAAEALGKIGVREGVPGLVLAIKHESKPLRETGLKIRSLLEDINKSAAQKLNGVLDKPDPDADVRVQVALALGNAQHYTSIPPLVKALTDPDANVREAARRALNLFKDQ